MAFLAAWAIYFQAFVSGTMVAKICVTFSFELIDFTFLFECCMVAYLKIYGKFTKASIVISLPNNDGPYNAFFNLIWYSFYYSV